MADLPQSEAATREAREAHESSAESGVDARASAGTTVLVVGIDFSSMSEHLLRTARDLVRVAAKAELHVVHVVPVQTITTGFIDALPSVGPSMADSIERAHERLDRLCSATIGTGVPAMLVTHVRVGNAADEIPRLADEVGADLIVVEAHGRTGLRRMLHRSVAAQLARNAPCSVLTVREKQPRAFEEARVPPSLDRHEPHEPRDEAAAVALDY